ncbi:helicase-related protein [Lactobacillus sp. YT155]|uniref:helicase-related protein n=1 Tax=Lactobacillus sp. YT155 TaxID=3060955 RepID=UPI00265FEB54|nr:helicase-related protein [Lactobacillus sp. YT155]MDO1605133.1 helicase-related protein [Lactobacillus sp. YT155]
MTDFNISNLANRVMVLNANTEKYLVRNCEYQIVPAIEKHQCNRCLGKEFSEVKGKIYCRSCLNFGRIDEEDKLIKFTGEVNFSKQSNYLNWQGQLSTLQQKVSNELSNSIFEYQKHLLWAVTGAGKTEILFQTINKLLKSGQRIIIVSPRIDVCEELYPRFKEAFTLDISLMHGQKEDRLIATQLTIATVHQLLKFEKAFDVIIVDEVDSYPLFGNAWLEKIINKALKPQGRMIYLSATPPKQFLRKVEKIYYLPLRFHGQPLPVPKSKMCFNQATIFKQMKLLQKKQQRFLLFFPSIIAMKEFAAKINWKLNFECVSSEDRQRLEIVERFRAEKIFALLTTTILERGVTFNNVDVLVYNADHKNFSKEVLIQIAGRAGRQKEHFDNQVIFYYRNYNCQIRHAIQEIKSLNKLGEKLS